MRNCAWLNAPKIICMWSKSHVHDLSYVLFMQFPQGKRKKCTFVKMFLIKCNTFFHCTISFHETLYHMKHCVPYGLPSEAQHFQIFIPTFLSDPLVKIWIIRHIVLKDFTGIVNLSVNSIFNNDIESLIIWRLLIVMSI